MINYYVTVSSLGVQLAVIEQLNRYGLALVELKRWHGLAFGISRMRMSVLNS